MNKYIAEFIGTFFLVLTIGCTGIGAGTGVIAPLAIGAALMVMVFAGGHISGAHYNPAVTLGVLIRGKVYVADVAPYMLAQLAGAAGAALVVSKFLRAGAAVTPISPHMGPALLAEFLFTFALVYVVLNAATAEGTSGNSFYGLAIGMTVMTGAFAVGDISGGALNPAVALGICILGISSWGNIWIYLVGDGQPVLAKLPEVQFIDDKEGKPIGIQMNIGRRPIAAFGNSDGDLQMLQWTAAGNGPCFCLYVHHTDAEREWAYDRKSSIGRLDKGLDEAKVKGWTVVSMKDDWKTIFPPSKK
jgi:aquaporin Z